MKKQKNAVITISNRKPVNPKGAMTRKEVGIYTGWSQTYIYLLVENGKLVPSVVSYYGTERLFTIKDIKNCLKQIKFREWNK